MNDTSKSVEDVGVLQQLGNSFEERRAAVTAKRQARLRRDCLNHVLIFSEQHLRQVLKSYALYYNEARTHLGLSKDTPPPRTIQCSGIISATPVLSGLPHRYARI